MSVSYWPESRLRHRCSSRYLRISPLHREFHFPLQYSSHAVSAARHRLSRCFSQQTYMTACAPFTPSNSGQRSPPTCYRGCWHVVLGLSRTVPSHPSSRTTEVYDPKTFIPHAASLGQGLPHCPIFPTAASRRSLDRVSVPVWPAILSDRLPVFALVGRYPTNQLIGREPIHRRPPIGSLSPRGLRGISPPFDGLSPSNG